MQSGAGEAVGIQDAAVVDLVVDIVVAVAAAVESSDCFAARNFVVVAVELQAVMLVDRPCLEPEMI